MLPSVKLELGKRRRRSENGGISNPCHSPLQWRHNDHDGVSNHQPDDCLLNCLFRRRSKKTSKLRVTGLYEGNSPVTGEFTAQRTSNAENIYIWWRHHDHQNIRSQYSPSPWEPDAILVSLPFLCVVRCGCYFKLVFYKFISRICILSISSRITLRWMRQDLTDD